MIVTADEYKIKGLDILEYLPLRIKTVLKECINDKTEEIRLRVGRPLSVKLSSGCFFVTTFGRLSKNRLNVLTVTKNDIETALNLLCNASVYAYEEEIKEGYITTSSGHRIGLSGDAVTENGKIRFINNISGLNFRIAHEIKGCADSIIRDVYNNSSVRNTLIVSPPGSGKTTLLRDLARAISNLGKNVSILDERGEISATKNGVPTFDIGVFSDVLQGCSKQVGIPLLLRSMAPDVIVTDELGGERDFLAIDDAKKRGVSIIATMHAKNIKDLDEKTLKAFECIIVLSSRLGVGTVEEIMIK